MANKNYSHIHSLTSSTKNSNPNHSNSDTLTSISFVLTPSANNSTTTTSTTTTTPSLRTLQIVSGSRPTEIYSENNTTNRSNSIVTQQPTFNKLFSEIIKEEFDEKPTVILPEKYTLGNSQLNLEQHLPNSLRTTTHSVHHQQQQQQPVIAAIRLNPRDATNGLTALSMAMTNTSGHLMSTLNPAHLQDGTESYFVPGLNSDLASYKIPQSSNSNLPSPSSSSNSSNHHHHQNHQTKRHGEGGDPTRKREMRLQKNREAARECRRKKKEYIKCLEERVTGLENQNKALIEELRQLKELYCQREETNSNNNNKTTTSTR